MTPEQDKDAVIARLREGGGMTRDPERWARVHINGDRRGAVLPPVIGTRADPRPPSFAIWREVRR